MNDLTKSKSVKANKLFGALVAVAVLGLSIGDALTGHGVKGNISLNQIVVGNGSSSSSSSSSTNNPGIGGGKCGTEYETAYQTPQVWCVDLNCGKGIVTTCSVGGVVMQWNGSNWVTVASNYYNRNCP